MGGPGCFIGSLAAARSFRWDPTGPPVTLSPVAGFLDSVAQRVVVFDGATGTNLHARELTIDDYGGPQFEGCPEILCDTRPDVIADLHRSFYDVGVDVVETNSFGAMPWVLAE